MHSRLDGGSHAHRPETRSELAVPVSTVRRRGVVMPSSESLLPRGGDDDDDESKWRRARSAPGAVGDLKTTTQPAREFLPLLSDSLSSSASSPKETTTVVPWADEAAHDGSQLATGDTGSAAVADDVATPLVDEDDDETKRATDWSTASIKNVTVLSLFHDANTECRRRPHRRCRRVLQFFPFSRRSEAAILTTKKTPHHLRHHRTSKTIECPSSFGSEAE
jgi:hypothetical protein